MDSAQLDVLFPTRRSLLASSRADGNQLSMFVPTDKPLALGTDLLLRGSFGDCDRRFELRGKVIYQRTAQSGQTPGLGLQFAEEATKRSAAELFAFCAGHAPEQGTQRSPRVSTAVECVVRHKGTKVRAQVRDLSTHGVFVASLTLSTLRAGTEVSIQLRPGFLGLGGVRLSARLVWSGHKNGRVGFGARFLGNPADIRPALRPFLENVDAAP